MIFIFRLLITHNDPILFIKNFKINYVFSFLKSLQEIQPGESINMKFFRSSAINDQILIFYIKSKSFYIQILDRKSTRLNSSHVAISYAVFCLKKKKKQLFI